MIEERNAWAVTETLSTRTRVIQLPLTVSEMLSLYQSFAQSHRH